MSGPNGPGLILYRQVLPDARYRLYHMGVGIDDWICLHVLLLKALTKTPAHFCETFIAAKAENTMF
jgi:hypothetical protein